MWRIREMVKGDLGFCDGLREQAGWNQTRGDWERFLELSPRGCFVAEMGGAVVGTVTTVSYGGELGWIGMLLVEAGARRQGIGEGLLRTALDYFREVKVGCAGLDATPEGEGLYRKVGFRSEWGLTRYGRSGSSEAGEAERGAKDGGVREFRREDLTAVIGLDARAFGVARARLMESLCGSAERAVVAESLGKIEGFGLLRRGVNADYLGPMVAESVDGAAAMARVLMGESLGREMFWDVPVSHVAAVRLAEGMGFAGKRSLVRMFFELGETEENCAGMGTNYFSKNYFGIADPSLG